MITYDSSPKQRSISCGNKIKLGTLDNILSSNPRSTPCGNKILTHLVGTIFKIDFFSGLQRLHMHQQSGRGFAQKHNPLEVKILLKKK